MKATDTISTIKEAKEWTDNYISILKGHNLTYKVMSESSNDTIARLLDNCVESARLLDFESVDDMYEDHKQRMIKLSDETKRRNLRKPGYIY